jgi:hypothetical protein
MNLSDEWGRGVPTPPYGLCALDAVEAQPLGLSPEELGTTLGHSRFWIRTIEERALQQLRAALAEPVLQ